MVATPFTPIASLLGGALIGSSAVLLMWATGRIAGVSGIAARLFPPYEDREFAGPAARISALAKDITEYLAGIDLVPSNQQGDVTIAYHSACSLQHGQKITHAPKDLLSKNGFVVKDVPESHLCCGSAGTYNILQPDIASRLRDRKVANIATVKPDMIAAGNIGCMVQIAGGTSVPVVHTIELLDWATGGPKPGSTGRD